VVEVRIAGEGCDALPLALAVEEADDGCIDPLDRVRRRLEIAVRTRLTGIGLRPGRGRGTKHGEARAAVSRRAGLHSFVVASVPHLFLPGSYGSAWEHARGGRASPNKNSRAAWGVTPGPRSGLSA